jgi:thiol-disulfide isomerase/thioredoxin
MNVITLFCRFFLAALLAVFAALAVAGEVPYDQKKFDAAVAAGKPVIVEFSANWCPTCKAQKPIVDELMGRPEFKDVTLFVADYDKEIALKKRLRVIQQSTFVVFNAGKEVTRSTGQTNTDVLAAVFDKAL